MGIYQANKFRDFWWVVTARFAWTPRCDDEKAGGWVHRLHRFHRLRIWNFKSVKSVDQLERTLLHRASSSSEAVTSSRNPLGSGTSSATPLKGPGVVGLLESWWPMSMSSFHVPRGVLAVASGREKFQL